MRILVSAVLAFTLILPPMLHGDGNTDNVICGQLALGEPPADIANQLHQGDPRHSTAQDTQRVLDATNGDCDG